jgi:hypothetical protein
MSKYALFIILIILYAGCRSSHPPVFHADEIHYSGELFSVTDVLPMWNGFVIACEIDHLSKDGSGDILLYYIDSKGEIIWEKIIGSSGWERPHCLNKAGENVVLSGITSSKGNGARDALIILFNRLGEILWERVFGGARDDEAYAIKAHENGFTVLGHTKQRGPGFENFWLLELNSDGEMLWERFFGENIINRGEQLLVMEDGYIIAGTSFSDPSKKGMLIYKVTASFEIEWRLYIQADYASYALCSMLKQEDGFLVLTAKKPSYDPSILFPPSYACLIAIDPKGKIKWKREYAELTMDWPYAAMIPSKNGYIISANGPTIFTAELNKEFEVRWIKKYDKHHAYYTVTSLVELENGYLLVGRKKVEGKRTLWLFKVDSEGNTH